MHAIGVEIEKSRNEWEFRKGRARAAFAGGAARREQQRQAGDIVQH